MTTAPSKEWRPPTDSSSRFSATPKSSPQTFPGRRDFSSASSTGRESVRPPASNAAASAAFEHGLEGEVHVSVAAVRLVIGLGVLRFGHVFLPPVLDERGRGGRHIRQQA